MMMKRDLYGLFIPEITVAIAEYGIESYRARQIAEWMYQRGVADFYAMTNLPLQHRQQLAAHFNSTGVTVQGQQESADGKTTKYLLAFADGAAVETVLMRQAYGNSICVSTQVGCAMGCLFCASTLGGIVRDLTGGEILAQVLYIQHQLAQQGQKVNSIVLMGAGEPLLNYDNVLRFIRLCHEKYILNLSYRNFTLSTSGIVPGIDRLCKEDLPLTLAISLHAPDNTLRSKLMPINNKYSLDEVMRAADRYASHSGRRVTYEYTLIDRVNDSVEQARQLGMLLKGKLANVNLIPVNAVPERGLLRPAKERVNSFEKALLSMGINVTVRREMGADIQAACGQLRQQVLEKNEPARL